MDVESYLAILWRRKWVIAITVIMTMAVVIVGTYRATPTYRASATVRISTVPKGSLEYTDYDNIYSERLMNTYVEIATSGPVLQQLQQNLKLSGTPRISAAIVPNSELLKITAEASEAGLARDLANEAANILASWNDTAYKADDSATLENLSKQLTQFQQELDQARQDYETLLAQSPDSAQAIAAASQLLDLKQKTYASLFQQYEQARLRQAVHTNLVAMVEPATTPSSPSSPRKQMNLALGLVVGLVGGVGIGFLFERLDTRLFSSRHIEQVTGSSILGKIPAAQPRRQVIIFNGNSPHADAFRRLRTSLLARNSGPPPKTVMITSAGPREGKSTVVANLAFALGYYLGRRVLVVDGDLHRPAQHQAFGLSNEIGLSTVLERQATVEQAIQDSNIRGICVLTSGPLRPNTTDLLASPDMASLIKRLEQMFDLILVDSPAFEAVSDAAVLARSVDAVVLVVSRNQARKETVQAACTGLQDLGAKLAGVIVTRAEETNHYSYYHR